MGLSVCGSMPFADSLTSHFVQAEAPMRHRPYSGHRSSHSQSHCPTGTLPALTRHSPAGHSTITHLPRGRANKRCTRNKSAG